MCNHLPKAVQVSLPPEGGGPLAVEGVFCPHHQQITLSNNNLSNCLICDGRRLTSARMSRTMFVKTSLAKFRVQVAPPMPRVLPAQFIEPIKKGKAVYKYMPIKDKKEQNRNKSNYKPTKDTVNLRVFG